MPTAEHNSWISTVLGINVGAVAGAAQTIAKSLPGGAMLPDCKPVRGKVPGPAQHLLCATHGHVLDIKEKKIIAISLEQYTSQAMGSAKAAGAAQTIAKSLPGGAMLPDCKPVRGKVPGPAQHLLCATHGHVLDIKEKKIIAISLEQYKSQGMGSAKAAHTAYSPRASSPAATAAPAQAPSAGAPSSADADAAKAQAEAKKILNGIQLELEDLQALRADHENLAGGGRLNRAVSWISDKLGGADDPNDALAEIAGQMVTEQMAGIAAVGCQTFDEAHKHLATMKSLNQKAHDLWQKYTGDTSEGAGRAVTGLEVASKAGDIATMGLNVVAPGTGKILSVAKNVSVTGSKLAFGEKVNWTEFTIDMGFDLFVGGEGGKLNKVAEKLGGPLAKNLAPKLSKAIAKKWGSEAAKKLGAEVTEDAIQKYIVTQVEEELKDGAKDLVKKVVDSAKDKDITNGQLADLMFQSMANPSGEFARLVSERVVEAYHP